MKKYECIIIGAGPAGIGLALKLQELSVECLILEKDSIGSSFEKWNHETRFITPSFTGNAFGQVDLNSIHHDSSPAYFHKKEHLSGKEYAEYLQAIVAYGNIQVKQSEQVIRVEKKGDSFALQTEKNTYCCNYLISAVGEFQFPSSGDIQGYKDAIHYAHLKDYQGYDNSQNPIPIIGGYESSIDSAYNLYKKGKEVQIFCPHAINNIFTSDPSKILSPYTSEKLRELEESPRVIFTQAKITQIQKDQESYTLSCDSGKYYTFYEKPILATGFRSGLEYLGDLISYRDDNTPLLNGYDELEKTAGIFVVGPQIRHKDLIFCFIFKFRLRFGVIALEIGNRLGKNIPDNIKHTWEKQGFFLDELDCCGDECAC